MVFKINISKHVLLRLFMLLALIGTAAVVDMYLASHQNLAQPITQVPSDKDLDGGEMYFCNQVNSYNLKTPAGEFSVRFRLACTQNKFLLKHYNLRTFQMMKAESLHSFFPVVCSFHALPFNRVLYASPDDMPPLS